MPDARIENCRILNIQVVNEPNRLAKEHIQVGQVIADLVRYGHSAPLLWCYNPHLLNVYARVPAVARLYHASENYFAMPGLDADFHARVRATIACSDLTVAVSDGVASDLRSQVKDAPVIAVSNGCDFHDYSAGRPDPELAEKARSFDKTAVYAGNINGRVDFDLLDRLVSGHPTTLFALYGPVKDLGPSDRAAWTRISTQPNVLAPGPIDPDRIPNVYAAADVGVIPYRQEPWLVENGFPLKALEMCATGLPVVSSLMKPLRGLTAGIVLAAAPEDFISAFAATSRNALSAQVADEMRAVCTANDYDAKFDQIIEELSDRVNGSAAVTRADRVANSLGSEYLDAQIRFSRWLSMPLPLQIAGRSIGAAAQLLPAQARRRLGMTALRQRVRRVLGS